MKVHAGTLGGKLKVLSCFVSVVRQKKGSVRGGHKEAISPDDLQMFKCGVTRGLIIKHRSANDLCEK